MAVTRIFVALNACASLELDHQKIIDFWTAAQTDKRPLTETDMQELAASMVEA